MDDKDHSIEITYTGSCLDADDYMVMHEGHTKFFKDWNEVMSYLIRWRDAKGLS